MRCWIVDAFAEQPFAGNPAAVVRLEAPRPDAWLQRVAAEFNLSETAFLLPEEGAWRLRWFTPVAEVDLCGHATLAAAHVLGDEAVTFRTRSGELAAVRMNGWIELDLPALPPAAAEAPPGLLAALGIAAPSYTGASRFDRLVEVATEEEVRALRPDFARLAGVDTRGVIVTSRGRAHDFVSRFFCPAVGIDEDPVTGSAHCVLGPYWAGRLGSDRLTGYQASARGGTVRVRVEGERVFLGGRAVTVLSGALILEA